MSSMIFACGLLISVHTQSDLTFLYQQYYHCRLKSPLQPTKGLITAKFLNIFQQLKNYGLFLQLINLTLKHKKMKSRRSIGLLIPQNFMKPAIYFQVKLGSFEEQSHYSI
jgi:hypothetical protein